MERMQSAKLSRLLGRGLLFRQELAEVPECPCGPDRDLLGWLSRRGLDEPTGAGLESGLPARHPRSLRCRAQEDRTRWSEVPTPGVETRRIVQRYDRAVDSLRD